jgi:hypothetical protein
VKVDPLDLSIRQLPQYRSHKVVRATPIVRVQDGTQPTDSQQSDVVFLEVNGGQMFAVTREWFAKFGAFAGGYLVIYEDGYVSFSPPGAFEAGYTPLRLTVGTAHVNQVIEQGVSLTACNCDYSRRVEQGGQPRRFIRHAAWCRSQTPHAVVIRSLLADRARLETRITALDAINKHVGPAREWVDGHSAWARKLGELQLIATEAASLTLAVPLDYLPGPQGETT